jgi:hypothetical protein
MAFDMVPEVIHATERTHTEFTWIDLRLGVGFLMSFEMLLSHKLSGAGRKGALLVRKRLYVDVAGQDAIPLGLLYCPVGFS